MKPHDRAQCEVILDAARAARIGYIVRATDDSMRARALLYKYRKEIGDPNLTSLQIRFSPDDPDNDLWIFNMSETSETHGVGL